MRPRPGRLLLITAASPAIQRVRRARVLNFQQITIPYLAAFVPPHWEVVHVDEAVSPVDVTQPADLVGLTFHTPSAVHAYDLAAQFRGRGVPVVVGGPHVSLVPDEAQAHADVVFVGEAEPHWAQFLADFESGRYERRYEATVPPELDDAPMARKDLYHRRDHTAGRLFATRGCACACDLCALAVMYQRRLRKRPVEAIAAEFASFTPIAGSLPSRASFAACRARRPACGGRCLLTWPTRGRCAFSGDTDTLPHAAQPKRSG